MVLEDAKLECGAGTQCDVNVISVYAGKSQGSVTEEMIRHGLNRSHLEHIISNPSQTRWTLPVAPSVQFYADLHGILKRKRIPVKDSGMVYRSIDPELCQSTTSNKEAYMKVQELISNCDEPSYPKDDSQSHSEKEVSSCDESTNQGRYAVPNVKRRERRAKTKIKGFQKSLK